MKVLFAPKDSWEKVRLKGYMHKQGYKVYFLYELGAHTTQYHT